MNCSPSGFSDSSGKNTGMGRHALLQGIFLTQGSNPHLFGLLPRQAGSLPWAPPGKPRDWRNSAKWMRFAHSQNVQPNRCNKYNKWVKGQAALGAYITGSHPILTVREGLPRAEDDLAEIRSTVLDGVGAVWTERGSFQAEGAAWQARNEGSKRKPRSGVKR